MATGTISKYANGTDTGWLSDQPDTIEGPTSDKTKLTPLYYRKIGNVVQINIPNWFSLKNEIAAGSSALLYRFTDNKFKPKYSILATCYMNTGTVNNRLVPCLIDMYGRIYLYANKTDAITTDVNMVLSATYIV